MKGKKSIEVLFGVFVVLFLVSIANAGTRGVTDDEIIIGCHTALSGPVAAWGEPSSKAIQMRFDEVNANGGIHGRKIKFIVEDSQYSVPIAVQKANKLINLDNVFMMVGSIGTSHNLATAKYHKEANVPNFCPVSWSQAVVDAVPELTFIGTYSYYHQFRAATNYFVKEKNKKRFCVMYQDTDMGKEFADGLKDQLKEFNMEVVGESTHKYSETNFLGAVNKMRACDCDIVALGTIVRDTIGIVKTAKKLGWNVDFLGGQGVATEVIPKMGGADMDGVYVASGVEIMYEDQATGRAKKFFDAYKAKYGETPGSVAQMGYTYADLAVAALENAGRNLTVDTFLKGAESIRDHKSIFGGPDRGFTHQNHMASKEVLLYQIKEGRFVSPDPGKKIVMTY